MTCPELINPSRRRFTRSRRSMQSEILIDFEKYNRLGLGHGLIMEWFERAADMKDCQGKQCFDAFFSLWVAFNGWASCVSDTDVDREYLIALKENQEICEAFKKLVDDPDSNFKSYVTEFSTSWPIIEVKSLRKVESLRRQIEHLSVEELTSSLGGKEALIRNYSELKFEPGCWKRHVDAGEQVPIDWPHTLSALYKFRCNLFHGEKEPTSRGEQLLASRAYHTLFSFLEYTNYIHW